ncbi:hypothetical protein HK104_000329 [Borealophlyctis nickersoniae]|nr:hypothetical protein HK104_000329 [Borealophlyctis nickersoniae]
MSCTSHAAPDPEGPLEKPVDEELEPEESLVPPLAPGDLVEIRRGINVYVGILAGIAGSDCHTVLYNGHSLLHRETDVVFQVPGWAFSPLVNRPAGSEALSNLSTVGLSAHSQMLLEKANIKTTAISHIEKFREAADKYAYDGREKLGRAWAHFAHKLKATSITVDELARWAFYPEESQRGPLENKAALVTPTGAELFAAFSFMARTSGQFRPARASLIRQSREFYLREVEEVEKLRWLWEQIRGHSPHKQTAESGLSSPLLPSRSPELASFLDKARTTVTWSREAGGVPTPEKPIPEVVFTAVDRIFIDALKSAAMETDGVFQSPYKNASLVGIIKPLYPLYDAKPHDSHIVHLLKEIGVWLPFENTVISRTSPKGRLAALEGHGLNKWADDVWEEARVWGAKLLEMGEFQFDEQGKFKLKSSSQGPQPLKAVGSPNKETLEFVRSRVIVPNEPAASAYYTSDPCANIRRDFGSAPVFVIDDPTAHELDDGISVEKTSSGTWIHVHIADPTAYIPPNHPLSLVAQLRGNSVYLPERNYSMMPEVLSDERFNLGRSQCAMTFSARLGSDGDIIDYAVMPAILRNVKILHYDDVDDVLDWSDIYGVRQKELERTPWVAQALKARGVNGPGIPHSKAKGLDEASSKLLLEIQKQMLQHLRFRVNRGGYLSDRQDFSIRTEPYPLATTPLPHTRPVFLPPEQHPTIVLNPNRASHLAPSHIMVSEAMVLAGRVASKFCIDNGIPAGFRVQPSILEAHPEESELVAKVLSRRDPISGVIPLLDFQKLLPIMPAATMTTKPMGHYSMGIPGPRDVKAGPGMSEVAGYVKVTSPLRRFKDMVMHWQIKQFLLAPNKGGVRQYLYDESKLQSVIPSMHSLEKRTRALCQKTDRLWVSELVRRREIAARQGKDDGSEGMRGGTLRVKPVSYAPLQEQIGRTGFGGKRQEIPTMNGLDSGASHPRYTCLVTGMRPQGAMCSIVELGGFPGRVVSGVALSIGEVFEGTVDKVDTWSGAVFIKPVVPR